MKEGWSFDRCILVLKSEIGLLKEIFAVQDKVRQAVMNREWADFDEKTHEIDRLSEEFALLEHERSQLFSDLGDSDSSCDIGEKPFHAAIIILPIEQRRELSYLYRELKTETRKMQAVNETFVAYLNEAKTLVTAYLEAACPTRGGKLYTRKGRKVSQDLRSIVINNSF
jgi:hypothetical protein